MKKDYALLTLLLFSISVSAQSPIGITIIPNDTMGGAVERGEEVFLRSSTYCPNYQVDGASVSSYVLNVIQGGEERNIVAKFIPKNSSFQLASDNLEDFWLAKNVNSLKSLSEIKKLYYLRSEMESDADSYINALDSYGLVLDDPYLLSYIYTLVNKIVPRRRADGFPYDIRVVIIRDPSLNACVFPNGTLVVNTGVLSIMHTEDELVALLAHEIAHFVANHTLMNVRETERRKGRAEFFAGLAAAVSAIGEMHLALNNDVYLYGSLTQNTAVLASSIAVSIAERMGTLYAQSQEIEADESAVKVLSYLNYDENACSSLLKRMADEYSINGDWDAYYLSGDHPSLKQRIENTGVPSKRKDVGFEKKVSFAITDAAVSKYQHGRFRQAISLLTQNIRNGVATDDDYLLMALCNLNIYDDSDHNHELYELIGRAKEINPNNSNIRRVEILVSLRNEDFTNASLCLDNYLSELSESMAIIEDRESTIYRHWNSEYDWARRMLVKVKSL